MPKNIKDNSKIGECVMELKMIGKELHTLTINKTAYEKSEKIVELAQDEQVRDKRLGAEKTSGSDNYTKNNEKSTTKDEAGNKDILSEFKNIKDVLNNVVSDEDLDKFSKLGIIPDEESPETFVTVYERIQIELMTYTDSYNPEGINIDNDKIKEVVNSNAFKSAMKKAQSIGDIDDETKKYIISNELEETINNLYKANFSVDKQKISTENIETKDFEKILPQVESLLLKSGMTGDEKYLESAKFLFENDLLVTPENIVKNIALDNIGDSLSSNIIKNMVIGRDAMDSNLSENFLNMDKVLEVSNIIENTESAIYYIKDKNLTLNAVNLSKYEEISKNYTALNLEGEKSYDAYIKIIEDAKNILTQKGLLNLTKLGIDIEFTKISDLTEITIKEEKSYYSTFFEKDDENIKDKSNALYNVMNVMEKIPSLPVSVFGSLYKDEEIISVGNIYNVGISLQNKYSELAMDYENVGTKVRYDLGDSIKKAFSNIENLIIDTGLESNEDYKRAVRVLGYNNMEVTKENIQKIAEKISVFENLKEEMTPKTAKYLIDNKVDIMNVDISELNNELKEVNQQIDANKNEKYSRFLLKMQKSGDISETERELYIEIYRTLENISSWDAKAIGMAVSTSSTMTLKSLLNLSKVDKSKNMDIKVDDETGYYEGEYIKNKYSELLSNITSTEEDLEIDKSVRELLNKPEVTEDVLKRIMDGNINKTLENINIMASLGKKDSPLRKLLSEEFSKNEDMILGFSDSESANENITNLEKNLEINKNEDIAKLKAVRFIRESARENRYLVPAKINDEEVLINITLKKGSDEEKGKISIEFLDDNVGKVKALLSVNNEGISGEVYISGDNEESEENLLENLRNNLDEFINEEKDFNIRIIRNENILKNYTSLFSENEDFINEIPDSSLYKISKKFIEAFTD